MLGGAPNEGAASTRKGWTCQPTPAVPESTSGILIVQAGRLRTLAVSIWTSVMARCGSDSLNHV